MFFRLASVVTLAAILGGCNYKSVPDPALSARDKEFIALAPKFDLIDVNYDRYEIDDPTGEKPGTIIVDTKANFLYLVLENKRAMRYGVATGTEALGWTGKATVARKSEWPRWMPPAEMVQRWPHLRPTLAAGGMSGGPQNPLGARALYLYQGNRDMLYRIHGTNEPDSIGSNASAGCIRMRNIDVVDLYNRTPIGATVIVR